MSHRCSIVAQSAVASKDGEGQNHEIMEEDGDPEGVEVAWQGDGFPCAEARNRLARDCAEMNL